VPSPSLPMAEAISPWNGSDQHRNIVWHNNKDRVIQVRRTPNITDRRLKSFMEPDLFTEENPPLTARGTAVTHGTEVYFSASSYGYPCPWRYPRSRIPHLVFNYNTSEDNWFILPECEVHDFGLAIVDGLVTVVGGEFDLVSPSVGPPPLKSSSLCFRRAGWILKCWTICSFCNIALSLIFTISYTR